MSGDPEQEYFADGMVEENTTQYANPSESAARKSPIWVQVDSMVDFFGLASSSFYMHSGTTSPSRLRAGQSGDSNRAGWMLSPNYDEVAPRGADHGWRPTTNEEAIDNSPPIRRAFRLRGVLARKMIGIPDQCPA
jgi:hypothetical protein